MSKYPVHSPDEQPPTRIEQGRPKSDNNDSELVAEGLKGIEDKRYTSYSAAAKDLAPRARQKIYRKKDKKYIPEYVPSGADENTARRLAKKISAEHKKALQNRPTRLK